ncbi:MAG: response regulator transcription factor [Chitinophagaceae bacterium]
MNHNPIRISIIDNHKIVRKSWKMLLANSLEIQVVSDSDDSPDAVDLVLKHQPDVVLLDFNHHSTHSFSIAEKLFLLLPSIKIVCLSMKKSVPFAKRVMAMGIKGYLTKTSSLEETLEGIQRVHRGEIYICHEMKEALS